MSTDLKEAVRYCSLNIIDGPNREDIFTLCAHAYDKRYLIRINFVVKIANKNGSEKRKNFKIEQISSVRHVDESGNEFVLSGKCAGENFYGRPFTARYSTASRVGVIEVDISADRRLSSNKFVPDLNPGLL